MDNVASAKIRNVALVGHGGSGKTSLAEALLYCAGVTARPGRVEDGSTVCDFEPEEQKHNVSISLALAPADFGDIRINVIDTPGYADFVNEVEAALSVADLAIVVVSAVEGVEVQTEIAWRLAQRRQLPRLIFVNKLDRERADFERTLEQLRNLFGAGIAPLELPIGHEAAFHGVADLLTDTAITYDAGRPSTGAIPDEMEQLEHRVREALVEGIVVADDDLMERYLDGDVPSAKELETTLAHGVASGSVFPVVCGSATKLVAIDRLATFIAEIGPSPLERRATEVRAGAEVTAVAIDPAGPPLARVFKTIADPYVGRISLLHVLSGTLRPDLVLVNSRTHTDQRLHSLQMLRGKEAVPVTEASAGDIVAVPKLTDVQTGDTLAPKNMPVVVVDDRVPLSPVLSIALRPRAKGDEDKLMTALHRLQEEDGALQLRREDETHQTVLSGMGDTHLQIACERLHRKYGVDVEIEPVRVPYRETITESAEAEGRYKKQTGGHGQFGVCNLRVEPLERGAGFEFVDAIVGGAIPRQFIPAVEKGLQEAMSNGGVFGFRVVDVKVTCYDGKYHAVDSSEMSFKMAASIGFREALQAAEPVLLEPVSRLEVTVPPSYQGDVLGDLNARRGRVLGTEAGEGDEQTVVALVPTSELTRYATDLRSLTGGRGHFSLRHERYDIVPEQIATRLMKQLAAERG
ncbi:MAG: elongation factor G [Acidimicrobiales bacterium]